MSGYDEWLQSGDPGQDTEEWTAFMAWAEENLTDLDWEDDDAVDAAFNGPWRAYVEEIENRAEAEMIAAWGLAEQQAQLDQMEWQMGIEPRGWQDSY